MNIMQAQDLRHALRTMRRRPTLSLAVISAIALGIGALTAVASVIEGVLLRPLPYPQPDRVVWLNGLSASTAAAIHGRANPYDVADWIRETRSFSAIAAFQTSHSTLLLPGGPERVGIADVSPGMDRVLQLPIEHGRYFRAEDFAPGVRSVIVSDRLWRTRLGADPDIIGSRITLDATSFEVIGVLRPTVLPFPPDADVWARLSLPQDDGGTRRAGVWLAVVARLRDNVSLETARAEMQGEVAALRQRHPQTNRDRGIELLPLRDGLVGSARSVVLLLAGSVLLVLLIACANIGNMLLAAALDRRREFAVRSALGAGTSRLVRLLLTESAVLAGIGAGLGLLLAPTLLRALLALYPGGLPRAAEVSINTPVLLLTALVTALVTVIAGLPSLRQARRLDLQSVIRSGERGLGTRQERWLRHGFVLLQSGLSAAMLFIGILLLRTLLALLHTPAGFDTAHLLTFEVGLSGPRFAELAQESAFDDALLDRLRALPGVLQAGASSMLPLARGDFLDGFRREGFTDELPDLPIARLQNITPGYLETLGLPLRAGRTILASDNRADAPPVAVVNEALQRAYLPDGALGKRIIFRGHLLEVVGVVGDKRHESLREAARPELYLPRAQSDNPRSYAWVAVRTAGDPQALAAQVRRALAELDPTLGMEDIATMHTRIEDTLAPDRFRAGVIGALAVLALVLAVLGIYGVIAYAVSRETREIGIRMALGQSANSAVGEVLRRALALAGGGVAFGLLLGLMAGRLLSSFLAGVTARDPLAIVLVPVLLLSAAALAALGPARRAGRLDPATVLRSG